MTDQVQGTERAGISSAVTVNGMLHSRNGRMQFLAESYRVGKGRGRSALHGEGDVWMIQNAQERPPGRMARSWSPPEGRNFVRGELGAIVCWRKSDCQEMGSLTHFFVPAT